MRLNDEQLKELQDKFLGKQVKVPWVNTTGYGIIREDDYVMGKCEYLDYNPFFPNRGLQITINRMPITDIDYKKIELIEHGK